MKNRYRHRKVGDSEIIEIINDPQKKTVILLHGFGADASDLASLSHCCSDFNWIFPSGPLLVPFGPQYVGRAWFPVNIPLLSQAMRENRLDEIAQAFPPDLNEARELIEKLILDLEIPRSDLILGGFSQGAILAVETALKGSASLQALLIFSGTLLHEINWQTLALHHTPTLYFQSHGLYDPLLPFKRAELLAELLKNSGLKGEFHRFSGGHEIPSSILQRFTHFLESLL